MSSDALIPEFIVFVSEKGGLEKKTTFRTAPLTFGRVQGNDLVLPKGNVSKRHARLTYTEGRFVISDLNSTNGTYVNRQRISQPTILRDEDRIQIGDFSIHIEPSLDGVPQTPRREIADSSSVPFLEAGQTHTIQHPSSAPPREDLGRASVPPARVSEPSRVSEPAPDAPSQRHSEHASSLRKSVGLVWERAEKLGLADSSTDAKVLKERRDKISQIVDQLLVDGLIPVGTSAGAVLDHAFAELCDYGPLRELLRDPLVTSVSALRFDEVLEVRDGRAQVAQPGFSSPRAMNVCLDRLSARSKETKRNGSLIVMTTPDGARFTRLAAEVAADGPLFVIEKSKRSSTSLDELVRRGTISRGVATFLGQAVQARLNILVVGPKDEGASAVVGALAHASTLGSTRERIVCAAEAEDIELEREAMFHLALPETSEGLRETLGLVSMVPGSRLVLSVDGPAKMAACLEAVGSSSSGLIASYRGANLSRVLLRLPADLKAVAGISVEVGADWIASTFDVVVEVARLRDGRVRVLRVSELAISEYGRLEASDIFRFNVTRIAAGGTVEGSFSPSGVIPKSLAQLQLQGLRVETAVFSRPPSK